MRTIISIIALSIAASATPATAATAASSSTATSQAKAVKYCLAGEALTGSRLKTKECMTKAQWARRGVDIDALRRQ